ncbi:hypothetical protein AtEden1_Chr5g0107041 [Arabidopsis thaliana]
MMFEQGFNYINLGVWPRWHEERGFTSPQSRLTVADRNFCGVPVNPTMRLNVMTRGLRTTRSLHVLDTKSTCVSYLSLF